MTETTKKSEIEESKQTGHKSEIDAVKINEPSSSVDKSNKKDERCCCKEKEPLSLKNVTQIVYLCQVLSYFFGITAIVGIVINYCKRGAVKGTWLESHFIWQTRTFWIGLGVSIIGCILIFVLVGFLILAVNLVWIIYRVIKGWLLLQEGNPIPDSTALI